MAVHQPPEITKTNHPNKIKHRDEKPTMRLYRMITGPDDSAFCHRISKAISSGWELHGSASLTFDPTQNRVICGQAITKVVEDEVYHEDMTLGEY